MRLETKNLSVFVPGKQIIKEVSLSFAEGRRTAIIGANGAGKSTLLSALALLRGYTGEIFLDGHNIRSFGRKKLARSLAILPQKNDAPPDMTVARLVDCGRFAYRGIFSGGDAKEDARAVQWALEATNMKTLQDRQVQTLSGGERQRAWLAMVLAQEPQVLLLDEPTTYLDIAHQTDVMKIIREVNRERNMTVIMVLHDINHARQYADEVVIVQKGEIFAQGEPQKVVSPENIAAVFGVKAEIFTSASGMSAILPVEKT